MRLCLFPVVYNIGTPYFCSSVVSLLLKPFSHQSRCDDHNRNLNFLQAPQSPSYNSAHQVNAPSAGFCWIGQVSSSGERWMWICALVVPACGSSCIYHHWWVSVYDTGEQWMMNEWWSFPISIPFRIPHIYFISRLHLYFSPVITPTPKPTRPSALLCTLLLSILFKVVWNWLFVIWITRRERCLIWVKTV